MRISMNNHHFALVAIFLSLSFANLQAETDDNKPEPLALQRIMKDLGKDMQAIVGGIAVEDWSLVEQAAMRVADHPKPPLGEKFRILAFVGTDMGRFKSLDKETHDTATVLAEKAGQGDGQAVIETFARLQSSCLACHQAFRQPFRQHFYGQDDEAETDRW